MSGTNFFISTDTGNIDGQYPHPETQPTSDTTSADVEPTHPGAAANTDNNDPGVNANTASNPSPADIDTQELPAVKLSQDGDQDGPEQELKTNGRKRLKIFGALAGLAAVGGAFALGSNSGEEKTAGEEKTDQPHASAPADSDPNDAVDPNNPAEVPAPPPITDPAVDLSELGIDEEGIESDPIAPSPPNGTTPPPVDTGNSEPLTATTTETDVDMEEFWSDPDPERITVASETNPISMDGSTVREVFDQYLHNLDGAYNSTVFFDKATFAASISGIDITHPARQALQDVITWTSQQEDDWEYRVEENVILQDLAHAAGLPEGSLRLDSTIPDTVENFAVTAIMADVYGSDPRPVEIIFSRGPAVSLGHESHQDGDQAWFVTSISDLPQ